MAIEVLGILWLVILGVGLLCYLILVLEIHNTRRKLLTKTGTLSEDYEARIARLRRSAFDIVKKIGLYLLVLLGVMAISLSVSFLRHR